MSSLEGAPGKRTVSRSGKLLCTAPVSLERVHRSRGTDRPQRLPKVLQKYHFPSTPLIKSQAADSSSFSSLAKAGGESLLPCRVPMPGRSIMWLAGFHQGAKPSLSPKEMTNPSQRDGGQASPLRTVLDLTQTH